MLRYHILFIIRAIEGPTTHTHAYRGFYFGMRPFIISALFMAFLSFIRSLTPAVGYLI